MRSFTIATLAIAALSTVCAAGGFGASCSDCWTEQTGFSCDCQGKDGRSYVNVQPFLDNQDGNLVWKKDGDTAKCRDCYIFPEGGQFGCTCKDNGGHDKDSSIDMNEHITNRDGNLTID